MPRPGNYLTTIISQQGIRAQINVQCFISSIGHNNPVLIGVASYCGLCVSYCCHAGLECMLWIWKDESELKRFCSWMGVEFTMPTGQVSLCQTNQSLRNHSAQYNWRHNCQLWPMVTLPNWFKTMSHAIKWIQLASKLNSGMYCRWWCRSGGRKEAQSVKTKLLLWPAYSVHWARRANDLPADTTTRPWALLGSLDTLLHSADKEGIKELTMV